MKLFSYSEPYAGSWDEFVKQAPMGTFLHSRRYLSYHGDRFQDVSVVLENESNGILGVFPAATHPSDGERVISHPGITYGGLIHGRELCGERALDALRAISDYYREHGFEWLQYKAVPYIYHRLPSSDDLYALFRLGAMRYRCDLSCAIDLSKRPEPAQRRQRGFKKAAKAGVEIERGARLAGELWPVLEENLARKYNTKPVHSLREIVDLQLSFPENIEFIAARMGSKVVAGIVLFSSSQVAHVQYAASSSEGHASCALDAVFAYSIDEAVTRGMRYFDFGISNEQNGTYLNTLLYQFKSEFGGGGVVHEFFEIKLRS
jgi:hypothetical protein